MSAALLSAVPPKPKRPDPRPAEQSHDAVVLLAAMLPQFTAEADAVSAELEAINQREPDFPRVKPQIVGRLHSGGDLVAGPSPEDQAALRRFETAKRHDAAAVMRRLKVCRERVAAASFAQECLKLREALTAASPTIEQRIAERQAVVDAERQAVRAVDANLADLVARRDALQAQREAVASREADIGAAEDRLARAADAGDDKGADTAAREISRIRRELVEKTEPLELRLQAAVGAVTRAEAQQAKAAEQLKVAEEALRAAELDRLKLARDEAAVALRDADLELWTAGFSDSAPLHYSIGTTPEILAHLRGRPQEISSSFLGSQGEARRLALGTDRQQAP